MWIVSSLSAKIFSLKSGSDNAATPIDTTSPYTAGIGLPQVEGLIEKE
jgi:hypothetical protein